MLDHFGVIQPKLHKQAKPGRRVRGDRWEGATKSPTPSQVALPSHQIGMNKPKHHCAPLGVHQSHRVLGLPEVVLGHNVLVVIVL